MSPRKSSTSSGKRTPSPVRRPRYLGIEVTGEPVPSLSLRAWESLLADRLASAGETNVRFRLIRAEGLRAIAEVDQFAAPRARAAWAVISPDPRAPALLPFRTWGTLVRAKAWLRGQRSRARTP